VTNFSLAKKITLIALFILLAFSAFMFISDPYALVSNNVAGKTIPYYPWYHYNFIRKVEKLDFAFVGSSQVNYFPIEKMYDETNKLFSMGIESSNIHEHTTYGKIVVHKRPKEVWFFVTFYALNPARENQKYFNELVMSANVLLIDFVYEYFHKNALIDAFYYIANRKMLVNNWTPQIKLNGTRTQRHYLDNPHYEFEKTLADYLSWISIDPRYYNSKTFRNPASIKDGLREIAEFKRYAEVNGVQVRFATAPVHRTDHALMYLMGLGKTYQTFREELAKISPFVDLDLDTDFTSNDANFWDTHHVRNGAPIINSLKSGKFLVTSANVKSTASSILPTSQELKKVQNILKEYDNWPARRKLLADDLLKSPARVE
jgi:hypothetical protein